ncbi:TetR/AcrR family transcriptional regulator [Marinobacterium lutimaris]|uniref:Transcriptional regulator, TetR family n=1 Tax=Marinobacterium lutimaris TaxID=568106 RepID=A0A1H5VTD7_9GAMM|nr:TetR/AcrR family transcriptional regulator [Marinobacterium lutimaris]SEF90500.1 transcriptional regulator, TetR family [Marinobacterium lutimaris]
MTSTNQVKSAYHHGDLRSSLLQAATDLIAEGGVDALSMRKLADRVGVSRTAPYHHFTDKHALLSALAEEGFKSYEKAVEEALAGATSEDELLFRFARSYLEFAQAYPETYNLMFGQSVWKAGIPTEQLKTEAYHCFRRYVEHVTDWQQQGLLSEQVEPLHFAQVSWSTLHGLARLLLDGIYIDLKHLDDLINLAVRMFRNA